MYRHHHWLDEDAEDKIAQRQTEGLVGIAIVLLLLGGMAFLAFWNPPPPSAPVQKVIPDARFPK